MVNCNEYSLVGGMDKEGWAFWFGDLLKLGRRASNRGPFPVVFPRESNMHLTKIGVTTASPLIENIW